MSHQIVIQLDSNNLHIETCHDIINQINDINKWVDDSIAKQNNELIEKANNIIQYIQNTKTVNNNSEYLSFLSMISTIRKEMVNLSNFNKEIISNNFYKKLGNANEFDLLTHVKKHGILANEVIEYLKSENIEITNINFEKYIDEVQNIQLNKQKLEKYIHNSLDAIQNLDVDSDIKIALSNKVKKMNYLVQLKDINVYLSSKQSEVLKVKRFSLDIMNSLKQQGFSLNSQIKPIWKLDENDNVILKLGFKNSKNNTVLINFDSTMHINYKLGNYIGHACEATTKKLLEDIVKKGYTYNIIDIKRDFDQPITMKQNLNKKGSK